MKRVLIFSHNFPPAIDGGSRILFKISRILKKENQVKILTSDAFLTDDYLDPEKKRIKKKNKDFEVIRLKTFRHLGKVWRRITPGPVFLCLPVKKLKKYRPDLIISGVFPTSVPFYAWVLAKIMKTKMAILPCFHSQDQEFYSPLLIKVLKKADFILALTEAEKDFYLKSFKIKKEKIIVFRPPIDKKMLLKAKAEFKEPAILFLGNQAAHKRIELLINAFQGLALEIPDLKLIIAGQKTLYSPKIKKRINQLDKNLRGRIKIIGRFNQEKEKELIDQAWVLVNPSIHESLGLVFLEAWARKKPVIGADLLVLKEIISHNQDGLLFKKNDLRDLTEKLKVILKNKKKAEKMGRMGYKKVRENYVDSDLNFWF